MDGSDWKAVRRENQRVRAEGRRVAERYYPDRGRTLGADVGLGAAGAPPDAPAAVGDVAPPPTDA